MRGFFKAAPTHAADALVSLTEGSQEDLGEAKRHTPSDAGSDSGRSVHSYSGSSAEDKGLARSDVARIAKAQIRPLQEHLQSLNEVMQQMQQQTALLLEQNRAAQVRADQAELRAEQATASAKLAAEAAVRQQQEDSARRAHEDAQRATLHRQEVLDNVAAAEQARADAAPPPSVAPRRAVPDAAGGQRMRGGTDRIDRRIEVFTSELSRDLDAKTRDKIIAAFRLSLEVPLSPPLHARSVATPASVLEAGHSPAGLLLPSQSAGTSASSLVTVLQQAGMMKSEELDEPGTYGREVAQMLRDKVDKHKSKYPRFSSFADFYTRIGRKKLLSLDMFDTPGDGEEAYWQYDWHFKCTTYLYTEFDWTVAATYDRLVMQSWDDIDVKALADSKALRKGDFERACESFALSRATAGATRRAHPEDKLDKAKDKLFCTFCKKWGKHLVADCRKAAAAKGI